MRSKKFRKLRKQMHWYLVQETAGLFGDFDSWRGYNTDSRIAARNAREAANRYMKRRRKSFQDELTTEFWGRVRILPEQTPYSRFKTYWT